MINVLPNKEFHMNAVTCVHDYVHKYNVHCRKSTPFTLIVSSDVVDVVAINVFEGILSYCTIASG